MPTEFEEGLTDPFSDLDTQESDVANLDELLTPLNSGVTAAEYFDEEDDLCTCFTCDDTDELNWREGLRAEAIIDCSQRSQKKTTMFPLMKTLNTLASNH